MIKVEYDLDIFNNYRDSFGGGGIIFSLSMIAWAVMMLIKGNSIASYLPFLIGLVLICGVSFWDDVRSLPDSVRPVVPSGR